MGPLQGHARDVLGKGAEMPEVSIPQHYCWKGRDGNAPMIREPTGECSWAPGRLPKEFGVNRESALLLSGLANPGSGPNGQGEP